MELGADTGAELLFLQMLLRLKTAGFDPEGPGAWICKITCADAAGEKIRKAAKTKKDLLILEEENAPDQVIEKRLGRDRHRRQSLLFLAAGTKALSFLIDLDGKKFEIAKEREAVEITGRFWKKSCLEGQKMTFPKERKARN